MRQGSADSGGSFYFVKYGVQVLQPTNTLIAFKLSDPHGSSLLHRAPTDKAWCKGNYQMGLTIVSSPRLASVYCVYNKGQLKKSQAEKILEEQEGGVKYK